MTSEGHASNPAPQAPADAVDKFVHLRPWYVGATIFSSFGNAMVHLATAFVIYNQTKSVTISALISVFGFLPSLVLGGPATYLVGRLGGPKLFVAGGIGLAAVGVLPLVASFAGHLTAFNLLVWQLLVGIIIGLVAPAGGLVTRMMAKPGRVASLNASLTRAKAIAVIAGLLLGGALYDAVGTNLIFIFNIVSYAGPIACVMAAFRHAPPPQHQGRLRDLRQLAHTSPGMKGVFIAAAFCSVGGCFVVALPALATAIDSSASTLAYLKMAYAVGGLAVVTAVHWISKHRGWAWAQNTCLVIMAAGLIVLALVSRGNLRASTTLVATLVLLVLVGFAVYLDTSVLSSLAQIGAPPDQQGAVLTGVHMVPMVVIPISQLIFGAIADSFSVSVALVCCAAGVGAGFVLLRLLDVGSAMDVIGQEAEHATA